MIKKHIKELAIVFIQISVFYLTPAGMLHRDPIGAVMLMLATTFVLSFVLGLFSDFKVKYVYPLAVSLLFLPSVPIFYNESAFVHIGWYFVVSAVGMLAGMAVRYFTIGRRRG